MGSAFPRMRVKYKRVLQQRLLTVPTETEVTCTLSNPGLNARKACKVGNTFTSDSRLIKLPNTTICEKRIHKQSPRSDIWNVTTPARGEDAHPPE